MKLKVTTTKEVAVSTLKVSAQVRYWEDSEVNGEPDETGELIPCRNGKNWEPVIDVATGVIKNWTIGTTAEIHYKVCDAGLYTLLDTNNVEVAKIEGYVPSIMSPKQNGYGDYIIMDVDKDGKIADWDSSDLSAFES